MTCSVCASLAHLVAAGCDCERVVIGSDARDALNRYAEHATTALGASWTIDQYTENRDKRAGAADTFVRALLRDNPDLLPEYTAAVLADEIKRGVRR